LKVRVLCSSKDEPAAQVTQDVILGSLANPEVRRRFLDQVHVITFESEFVDASILGNLNHQNFQVFPSMDLMNRLRDRKPQKDLLKEFEIPCAPSIAFRGKQDLLEWFKGDVPSSKTKAKAFVLKKRLFGYDGYGTLVIKTREDLLKIPEDISPNAWIAEEFCPFKRELAFSLARTPSNRFYLLPLVETKQTQSKCDWVKGPIHLRSFEPLVKKFKKMMSKTDYVGLLSIELFQTQKGILVNELAPRVHNSAHYSIEALLVSQFEAHLRAILDWPFPKRAAAPAKGFAMANLIGKVARMDRSPVGFLHWYGKTEMKPGRKMGHLTALSSSPDKALEEVLKWRKKFGSENS